MAETKTQQKWCIQAKVAAKMVFNAVACTCIIITRTCGKFQVLVKFSTGQAVLYKTKTAGKQGKNGFGVAEGSPLGLELEVEG